MHLHQVASVFQAYASSADMEEIGIPAMSSVVVTLVTGHFPYCASNALADSLLQVLLSGYNRYRSHQAAARRRAMLQMMNERADQVKAAMAVAIAAEAATEAEVRLQSHAANVEHNDDSCSAEAGKDDASPDVKQHTTAGVQSGEVVGAQVHGQQHLDANGPSTGTTTNITAPSGADHSDSPSSSAPHSHMAVTRDPKVDALLDKSGHQPHEDKLAASKTLMKLSGGTDAESPQHIPNSEAQTLLNDLTSGATALEKAIARLDELTS
eukprot:jgi/Chrzof1/15237/Cz09g32160.t1